MFGPLFGQFFFRGTDLTQLTQEMNKFDDMMNYLKRRLREVYSEARLVQKAASVASLGGMWEGLADTLATVEMVMERIRE